MLLINTREITDTEDMASYAELSPVLRASQAVLPFGLLVAVAVVGLQLNHRLWVRWWAWPGMLLMYGVSVSLFYVSARYRLPLVPLLCLFAATGVVRTRQAICRRNWRRAGGAAVTAGLCGILTSGELPARLFISWPDISPTHQRAATEFNLALARQRRGDPFHQIEEHYRRAVRFHLRYVPAWHYWGGLLFDEGRLVGAIQRLRIAARLDSGDPDIWRDLGEALLHYGEAAIAARVLERSNQLAPEDPESLQLLGRAYFISGRVEDALPVLRRASELDADSATIQRLLAITLDKLGQRDAARVEFLRLIDMLPEDSPEAAVLRSRWRQRGNPLQRDRE
ncbi:MAG: tetratricopeptide repeat protein [Planctomycetaceae bacterium]